MSRPAHVARHIILAEQGNVAVASNHVCEAHGHVVDVVKRGGGVAVVAGGREHGRVDAKLRI